MSGTRRTSKYRRMNSLPNSLKIVTTGDDSVGKRCLLITFTKQEFPKEYKPVVFDNYEVNILVDGISHNVIIRDTGGLEGYEDCRSLTYIETDVFLLCYSVDNRSSFENIISKWYPELKHHCPHTPIILVATKVDLRESIPTVSSEEGRRIQQKIKALKYMECSALKKYGINEIFIEAVRAAISKRSNSKHCLLL